MTNPKKSWWKKLLHFTAFGLLALVTITVLVLSWISFQGRREWAAVRQELLAKGEKLTRVELAPPLVPDAENFFADPIWRPAAVSPGSPSTEKSPIELLDTPISGDEWAEVRRRFPDAFYNQKEPPLRSQVAYHVGSILQTLPPTERSTAEDFLLRVSAPLAGVPAKIAELLGRPQARFSFDYGGIPWKTTPYPGLYNTSSLLAGLAFIHLSRRESEPAARLALDNLHLTDTLAHDPILYTQMIRAGIHSRALGVIHVGLNERIWSDAELASLQAALAHIDLLPGMALAFRGERGFFNQTFEAFHRMDLEARNGLLAASPGAQGLAELRGARIGPIQLPDYLSVFGPGDQAADNRQIQTLVEAIDHAPKDGLRRQVLPPLPGGLYKLTHFFTFNFRAFLGNQAVMIGIQMNIARQATAACALERYRLSHGEFPDHLADIVPAFLPAIPRDVLTLEPMTYRRTNLQAFTLAAGDEVWSSKP